jgi:predicted phage terminase large subunit-like protein
MPGVLDPKRTLEKPAIGFTARDLNDLDRALQRESMRRLHRSHHAFTKAMWPVIEPGREFIDNWHLHAVSDCLEQVHQGAIKFLIINIPPRHMKSIGVSVTFCPWEWGPMKQPHQRYIYASYANTLAIRDSLKSRRIIQSPLYQLLYGDRFSLSGDQNAKVRFENSMTGYRIATSVGGIGTGEGGDRVIVDDPHNVAEAESEVVRETTVEWWTQSMSTRINDARTGAHIIVMQRVHESDLTGYELKEHAEDFKAKIGEAVHLMLPARFEKSRKCSVYVNKKLFFEDPRKAEGEILWPARFDDRFLSGLEKSLGSYGAAGQLQQRPAPIGGGIIKTSYFKKWPTNKETPDFTYILQSLDTAFTEKTTNDPTAFQAWGLFENLDTKRTECMLLDAWEDHIAYPALRKKTLEAWKDLYGGRLDALSGLPDHLHPPRRADQMLIEEKGSGLSLRQDIRQAGVPAAAYNPGHADKVARAHMAAPFVELGIFWIPESRKEPGEFTKWARPMLKHFEDFPNGEHDDHVDAFTQTVLWFRNNDLLKLPQVIPDEPKDRDYYNERKMRRNPYGV